MIASHFDMLRIFYILFLLIGLSPLAHAQSIDTVVEINGRKIRYQESNPREVKLQRVTINGRTHTVKAYGTMYVSFMASMIATEMAYCFGGQLPNIHANIETPNCRDEIEQMLLDPGMNLGILAMTATSLEFYRQGDKVLKKFLNRLLSRTNPNGTFATAKTRKVLRLSRTLLQHLGMGAGMIMQTSIASSWNAPKMRECFAEIKKGIGKSKEKNHVDSKESLYQHPQSEKIISSAVDEKMLSNPCLEAKKYYFDAERGTISEIAVTVMSLGASTVISGALVTSVRLVGMIVLGSNPAGLGLTASLIVANISIEMVDRILEPYIRAFYHAWNSRRLMKNSFAHLIDPLDHYQQDKKLIRLTRKDHCVVPGPQFTCHKSEVRETLEFPAYEAIKDYNYAINYRREAKLNRFIENHGRWEAKVSSLLTVVSQYQSLMRKVYEIRSKLTEPLSNLDTYYNFYSPISYVEDFDSSQPLDIPRGSSHFNKKQLRAIYSILNEFRKKISLNSYDQNRMLRLLFEELHTRLHQNETDKIFITLWRLKNMVEDMKLRSGIISTHIQTGVDFKSNDFERIQKTITNMFTSFTPQTLHSFLILEAAQLSLLEEVFPEDEDVQSETPLQENKMRKGIMMSSDPMQSILEVNKDDSTQFYSNQESKLRSGIPYGLQANTVPSRILTHLLCGDFSETRFFHNPGKTDTLALPNILSDPKKIDCNYKSQRYGIWDKTQMPDKIFMVNPMTSDVRQFLTDESNHRIFSYNGKEHLGLLSILIDPDTQLRWDSYSDFSAYWHSEMAPALLRFLLEVREEYYVTLRKYFKISENCSNDDKTSEENCQNWKSKVDITRPLTEDEVNLRAQSFRYDEDSDEAYYSMIGVAETFAEEARTYAYTSQQIFGENSELTRFLKSYIPRINVMIQNLNLNTKNLKFQFSELSDQEVTHKMSTDPAIEAIGQENFESFVEGYQTLYGELILIKSLLPSTNIDENDPNFLENLSEKEAKELLASEMLSNLEQSLQFTVETLLEKYIGGDRITYLGN